MVIASETPGLEAAPPKHLVDYWLYYRPNAESAFSGILEGVLPFWESCQALGRPFLATVQTGVLYPPNWLHAMLPSQPSFAILAALHLALAAGFAGALAGALGAGRFGSLVAGLCFGLSSYLCAAVWTPPVLYGTAWMPGILFLALRTFDHPGPRTIAALAAAASLQVLTGWPYVVLITIATGGLLVAAAAIEALVSRRAIPFRAMGALLVAGLLAAAISSPQLVPTYELASLGPRAFGTLDSDKAIFMETAHLPSAVSQQLLRTGVSDGIPSLGTLVLALLALLLPGPQRARCVALFCIGTLALLVSFGDNTPLYGWLRQLPLFSDFRFPMRYRAVSTLAVATLAGVGAGRLVALQRPRSLAATLVAVGAAGAAASFQGFTVLQNQVPFAWRKATVPPDLALGKLAEVHEGQPSLARILWDGQSRRLEGDACLPLVNDLEPLSVGATAELLRFLEFGGSASGQEQRALAAPFYGRVVPPADASRAPILDLLGVGLVVSDAPPPWMTERLPVAAMLRGRPLIYENPGALPRTFRVTRLVPEPSNPEAAHEWLVSPGASLRTTALLHPAPGSSMPDLVDAGADPSAEALIEEHSADRVAIRTRGATPGVVILMDAFYPGWTATLDGASVPIHRANRVGRGVVVPAGEHLIEMQYRPSHWSLCVAASLLALTACAALALRRAR